MKESLLEKGKRLVASGHVQIVTAGQYQVTARVLGDSGTVYETVWDNGRWTCECAAFKLCGHMEAVRVLALRAPNPWPEPTLVTSDV